MIEILRFPLIKDIISEKEISKLKVGDKVIVPLANPVPNSMSHRVILIEKNGITPTNKGNVLIEGEHTGNLLQTEDEAVARIHTFSDNKLSNSSAYHVIDAALGNTVPVLVKRINFMGFLKLLFKKKK